MGCYAGGRAQFRIQQGRHFSAVAASEAHRCAGEQTRHPQGVVDVGGIARCADAKQHVTGAGQRVYLLGKTQLAVHIVGKGRGQGHARNQRYGGNAALQGRQGILVIGIGVLDVL